MSKEEAIKIDTVWYNRNPVHEINADTGKDMFDGTMRICMSEYAEQEAIAFRDWCDNGNAWFWDNQEQHTHTTKELYQLFKQQP